MLPNFIIIGAQKSATTFLHQCLRYHPDIFMPSDEISFFEDPDYSQSNIGSFEKLFEEGNDKKLIGMKRPSYLHKPECPERIHRHIPSSKLIVILRDPLERAISAYYHNARYGFAPIKNVNKGLLEIIDGRHVKKFPRASEIIEFGFYYKHLTRYLEYFDRKQILIILYDKIKNNPIDTLKEVLLFLDVDEQTVPKSLQSHPMTGTYSIPRLRFLALQNPISFTYSKNMMRLYRKKEIGIVGKTISKAINLIDRNVLSLLFSSKKPRLSSELMMTLSTIYKTDIENLEGLLGISLVDWKQVNTTK